MIKKYNDYLKENQEQSIKSRGIDFKITHPQLDEILYEITDEFPLDYYIGSSEKSSVIKDDINSFIVELTSDKPLYYLEPKIFD